MAFFPCELQKQIIQQAVAAVTQQSPPGTCVEFSTLDYVHFAVTGIVIIGADAQVNCGHLPYAEREYERTPYPTYGRMGFDYFGIIRFGTVQPCFAWEEQIAQSVRKYVTTYGKGIDKCSLIYALQFLQCIPLPTVTDLSDSSQWKPFIKTFIHALHGWVDDDGRMMGAEEDDTIALTVPPTVRDVLLIGVFNNFISNTPDGILGCSISDTVSRLKALEPEWRDNDVNTSLLYARVEQLLAIQFRRPQTPLQYAFSSIPDPTTPSLRAACVAYFRWTFEVISNHDQDSEHPGFDLYLPSDLVAGTIHMAWHSTSTSDEA